MYRSHWNIYRNQKDDMNIFSRRFKLQKEYINTVAIQTIKYSFLILRHHLHREIKKKSKFNAGL